MAKLTIDETVLRALQQRAEQMARGELCELGQGVCDVPAVEDLRRAIDVFGAHTKQGLQHQHAYIASWGGHEGARNCSIGGSFSRRRCALSTARESRR
jgi:hypothetical protein